MHTPRPWHKNTSAKYPIYAGEAPNHTHVAWVESDDDLDLIAAAPDLLEVLREYQSILGQYSEIDHQKGIAEGDAFALCRAYHKAEAVIRQAEGQKHGTVTLGGPVWPE